MWLSKEGASCSAPDSRFKMFFILLFLIPWFPTTCGKLQAVCSFGMNVLKDQNQNASALIKITGRLSNDSNLQRSCVLRVDKPDSFLRVRAKRNDNSTGFLHIFMYEGVGSALLGHVDVSKPAPVWNTLTLPPSSVHGQKEKYISVLGISGLSFTVEIADSSSEIMLNKPQETNVESGNVMVFRFIPPKGISNTQLDITVTSQSNVPAYLKVSQTIKDVQENIEVIDYKKESLRLSFAKKGRITLSKASVPPLTDSDSSWFIGIALKNARGSVKVSDSKYVTLELKKSFDYSYAAPICTLFFVSLVGGIVMSIIALLLFKESLVAVNTPNAIVIANTAAANTELQDLPPAGNNNRGNNNADKMNKTFGKFILAMLKVSYNYWFSGGPKTFSYITGIVGFVLIIGAFQFVFANWYIMIQEGDRDNCFYNDFCYRVSSHDIPFNLMISNLAYIIHGLILAVCVWYMETELYLYCKSLENFSTTGTSDKQQDILPDHVMVCPDTTPLLPEGAVSKHTIETEEKAKLKAQAPTTGTTSDEQKDILPDHVPNITPHLQEGAVPKHTIGKEELKAKLKARAPTTGTTSDNQKDILSDHVPNITPHLLEGAVPKYTIGTEEKAKLKAQAPTTGTTSDEQQDILPDHVLVCPNITPHLLEGAVPKHTIGTEEKAKLKAQALKRKYSFSIGYAFAWALLFEGMFSGVYHLCPSRLTFQFDSAFMFIIASLTILLLYNGIEVNECPSSRSGVEYPVAALNFFLFVIVPLFIFNYFGILYHSESGLNKVSQGFFFACLAIWWLVVFFWAFYKLKIRKDIFPGNACGTCWNECFFIVGGLIFPLLFFFLYLFSDLSQAFLFTCIAESLVAIFAKTKILQKLWAALKWLWAALKSILCCNCECTRPKCSATAKEIFQGVYIFFTVGVLVAALCVFKLLPTTDKTSSPEDSRDQNEECMKLFGFFDWHDLWHFLSSFALLMGAFVVMFISGEQVQSNENPSKNTARENTTRK